jgi:ketosteroid isomerase-like protein
VVGQELDQGPERVGERAGVDSVLTAFHLAASEADSERYFGLFAEDAVFIGTDASERWTVDAFRAYAEPYFERGQGWTYVATERHVTIAPDGTTAWFDEILDSQSYGVTRGTGVLVREGGGWKVAQYHLTIPVPNALAREVVDMIRARGAGGGSP